MALNNNAKKIKRVLLIEPPKTSPAENMKRTRPSVQPPLGLAYIAAVLLRENYEVKILDAVIEDPLCHIGTFVDANHIRYGISDDRIAKQIKGFNPDIVGVSCVTSAKYYDARNVCSIAKSALPDCVTVMGGVHPTIMPKEVLEDPNLDFIVLGEGDYSFLELIKYLQGECSFFDLDGVGGKINGKIEIIPKTKFIENLDELPFPARHLLSLDKYWKINLPHGETTRSPWTTIYTSRGCTASCIYCSVNLVWGKKYRGRSAANVLEEIRLLIKDYGIKELLIEDDNFSADKKRVEEILDKVYFNKWDLTWTTPSGIAIFTLDRKLLEKFKRSGFSSLTLAVESGSQRVLSKVMKKPLLLKKVEEVVRDAKLANLKTKGFFMLGIPGETKEEMRQTLEMARKLKLDWSCFAITTPLPGTELYDLCKRNNYIDKDVNLKNIEFSTGRIKTKEFDEDFVNNLWNEANNINFLQNPNLIEGGNLDQAIFDFKRVIRMVPNHELAHLALGDAYAKKGMIGDAIQQWQAVLAVNKDNNLAIQRLKECKKNGVE